MMKKSKIKCTRNKISLGESFCWPLERSYHSNVFSTLLIPCLKIHPPHYYPRPRVAKMRTQPAHDSSDNITTVAKMSPEFSSTPPFKKEMSFQQLCVSFSLSSHLLFLLKVFISLSPVDFSTKILTLREIFRLQMQIQSVSSLEKGSMSHEISQTLFLFSSSSISISSSSSQGLFMFGKGMGTRQYSLGEVGPPINPRAGLRREQAGRGSYRGSQQIRSSSVGKKGFLLGGKTVYFQTQRLIKNSRESSCRGTILSFKKGCFLVVKGKVQMGYTLQQILRSICSNTDWNYAVFWKLNHHSPM